MLAYIIFLVVCVLYHIFSEIFGFDFQMWERVIVSVTIASWCFSCSSLFKSMLKMEKVFNNYVEYDIKQLKQMIEEANKFTKEETKEAVKLIEERIEDNTKELELKDQYVEKFKSVSFWLDVSGYLVFFCILVFDWIFGFLIQMQEFCTLLAFLIVMFVEYAETSKYEEVEEKYKELIEKDEQTINKLKDYNEILSTIKSVKQ